MKKPRRGEVDRIMMEVRGIRDCRAIAQRCGARAPCAGSRQTLARLLGIRPRTGFDPHARPPDMKKPRRGEVDKIMVEVRGIEPLTSGLQSPRSPS